MNKKFPRTMHFDFSPGVTNDDKIIKSLDLFEGRYVVASKKKDGENTTMTPQVCHAKSLDSKHHPSRNWVKAFHGQIKHLIPEGYRVCGENLYAKHSIFYDDLKSYFYGFSVWNEKNVALCWDETLFWFEELGITPVENLCNPFIFDLAKIHNLINKLDLEKDEGIVIRVVDEIPYDDYDKLVAKWVRADHVQTDEHWMHSEIIPNKLGASHED